MTEALLGFYLTGVLFYCLIALLHLAIWRIDGQIAKHGPDYEPPWERRVGKVMDAVLGLDR